MTMKCLNKFWTIAIGFSLLTSCADNSMLDFSVEKPESIAALEYLNQYDVLKAYVDREVNPDFKLGAGVSLSGFSQSGVEYTMICSNFDEVTAGYGMKHGAVVEDDGTLNLSAVEEFLAKAAQGGLSVYGHTLVWHANQNAEFLNSTIAPLVIPGDGEPTWDEVEAADFENDEADNYTYSENAIVSFTAEGEGANGEGRAIKVVNEEVRENDWNCQFFLSFSPPMEVGEKYKLTMDVRADDNVSFSTQAHVVPFQYKHWDFFGSISAGPDWTTFVKEITVSEDVAGTGAIAFNLGNAATAYYFDNIKLEKYNESGGPTLEPSIISNSDFENGIDGWIGWGNNSTQEWSAEGEGYDGQGYAFKFTNPSATDFWSAQVAYDLPNLVNGSTYVLNFKVRASAEGTIRAEVQSTADYSSDSFGTFNISNDWQEYTLETTVTADDRNRFIISYGDFVGTVFIDDVTLRRLNPDGGGEQIIEKTPEEKRDTLAAEMERWIAGIMTISKDYVKAWDVVNEPMDDGNPYELKSGINRDLPDDHFYWQDYLGKDYAVMAFNLARQYGNPDDLLFINDYNLEYNIDKCKGLIQYVQYIEEQGATIDGIGTQMHISIDTDKDKIVEMFQLLAETGKLIKISELDIGIGKTTSEATEEDYNAQAEMYQFVVEKYFEIIPPQQRYGITVWSPTDSPEGSSWRENEPIGLWTIDYVRKPAYAGFAEGLAGSSDTGGE